MKETFIVRTEWLEAISELKDSEQAIIFRNLFFFHSERENLINLKNLSVKLVWRLIEPSLKRNVEAYDKRSETSSLNGKKGGRPKKEVEENLNNLNKPNEKPIETKEPNESLCVSDSDSVNDLISSSTTSASEDFSFKKNEIKEKPPFVQVHTEAAKEIAKNQITSVSLKEAILTNEICKLSAKNAEVSLEDFPQAVEKFIADKFGIGDNAKWKDLTDALKHFSYWVKSYSSIINSEKNGGTRKIYTSKSAGKTGRNIVEQSGTDNTRLETDDDGVTLRISRNGTKTFAG